MIRRGEQGHWMPGWLSKQWTGRPHVGSKPLWTLSAVIVSGILVLFLLELHSRYSSAIVEAKHSALSFAEVLAEHTARTFEAVDRTLQVAATMREDLAVGTVSERQTANQALRSLQRSSPALIAIGWTNAEGDVVAHTYDGDPVRKNISDLPHFTAQRDKNSSELFIAPPFRSAASGRWISAVSLRLNNADGSFAGVVTAPLDQTYFSRTYRSVNLGSNSAVTLLRRDGHILTREPFVESAIGKSFGNTILFTRHLPVSEAGAFDIISPIDGVARILAYKAVPNLPLIMLVTYDREVVLQPWYDHARNMSLMVAMLIAVILAGTLMLSRRTRELAGQTSLLEATLGNMRQGLIVVDENDTIAICNAKAMELLGLPVSLMTSCPRSQDVVEYQQQQGEFAEISEEAYASMRLHRSAATENIYERRRPDGTVLEVRTVPFAKGGVVRTYTDITARKHDEQELKDREARYRLLADNSTDMIFRLDLDFVRQYVSPACREIVGYSPAELINQKPVDMIHPDDADYVGRTYRAVAGGLERTSVTNRIRHRDGRWIWVEAELRLVRDPETSLPTGILGALRDVSARKAIEAEAAAARQQAENAAAAQGEFLATMSHELRTPLNGILGFADILLSRDDLAPEVRRQIGLIQTASDSLRTVVNDILDFSQIEEGRLKLAPTEFYLSDLIDDSVAIVRGFADAKLLELRVSTFDRTPIRLMGDSGRLRQVLLNLLNNAIKFTHAGHVSLEVTREASLEGRREQLRFSVSDSGIGIPTEKLDRLFRRFSQIDGSTSREFGGSGLGLAICKRLVELMGGEIGVKSTDGKGSTFWFTVTLPTVDADERLTALFAHAQSIKNMTTRVLLVEDVAINREIACSMVEAAGFNVEAVSDGADALAAMRREDYDIVLMDIQMPGMDGIAATKAIRTLPGRGRHVPIIAMTANVLPRQIETFRAAGMNAHVGKPFRREELIGAIEQCLSEEQSREAAGDDQPTMWPFGGDDIATAVPSPAKPDVLDEVKFEQLRMQIGVQNSANLLRMFAVDAPKYFVVEGDEADLGGKLTEEAHSLGGSAGLLGFDELMEACRHLEIAATWGEALEETYLPRVRQARERALEEIARLLSDDGFADPLRTTA